jgi:streptogramin lyase
MRAISQKFYAILCALGVVLCFTTALTASDAVIQGTVSDDSGRPIRGALVKASTSGKSVSRFTRADGRFEITLPSGTYDVSAEAYGYGLRRQSTDTAKAGDVSFRLPAKFDVTRLSSAEIESLLPENSETRLIKATCIDCHTLGTVLIRRGQNAAEWKGFLPTMPSRLMPTRPFAEKPVEFAALTSALEKYFGPDAPYFGPDAEPTDPNKVKHALLTDEAIRATIKEYEAPHLGGLPHSVEIDQRAKAAWFTEYGYKGNDAVRFDIATETFKTYPMLTPDVLPHTGAVGKDGRFWIALAAPGPAKLASVDSKTGEVKEYKWPERDGRAHTVIVDPKTGNLWFSGGGLDELWSFDVKKEQFKGYKYGLPSSWPKDSEPVYKQVSGQELERVQGYSYDVGVDSNGLVWFSEFALGQLVRLDPTTGETRDFKAPGAVNIRGIYVDPQDNIWFSSYFSHKIGKLDTKTGDVKYYQPPTVNATPYGWVRDPKTGYLWYADQNGNNITRLDPKTGQFVEYPIPTRNANPRFIDIDGQGRIWFTEFMQSKIGMIDPEGSKQIAAAH